MTPQGPILRTLPSEEIEAWTQQTAAALSSFSITEPPRVTGVSLSIPLDDATQANVTAEERRRTSTAQTPRPRTSGDTRPRVPVRRDSLKRREALLRGNEGSRRRQRWENDRLLNNPYAQPPLPTDWEVRPTYPVHAVPYYLAPLWDARFAAENATRTAKARVSTRTEGQTDADTVGKIPKELRQKLKKAKGAKTLLQTLEKEVRVFIRDWEANRVTSTRDEFGDIDSEEEEIVFVGRSGDMSDMRDPRVSEELERAMLVLNSPADDLSASFGRWLVHSIGSYYGLRTWSVTVGDPARREAYVGIKDVPVKTSTSRQPDTLPRPLWGLV
ncbi:hypothetical protein P152DRAFT_497875 [Eremomyces bilateralis CBS 781.70]|uniref:R3H-associated N-terminal domain-containing protein n=1 Tax=Eremomyces bilateralis CBS 781.70 TaxID=1392243 RepID=A0A6G1FRY7_9PEZI|nr:uncharacterized protein P152DRAFT_497875 [Eremomyces bilateralis CBS 781.70]KAF1808439.1 hypothetical protein P152DRAFT_497875 [Eremomyces bilateralis CBS 781.70]